MFADLTLECKRALNDNKITFPLHCQRNTINPIVTRSCLSLYSNVEEHIFEIQNLSYDNFLSDMNDSTIRNIHIPIINADEIRKDINFIKHMLYDVDVKRIIELCMSSNCNTCKTEIQFIDIPIEMI